MKKLIIPLFVLSMAIAGCRPVVMHLAGDKEEEPEKKEDINAQIEMAVKQLVRTMRPIYRDYHKYRQIYPITMSVDEDSEIVSKYNQYFRITRKNGEFRAEYIPGSPLPGDLGKIRLAILDIGNLSEAFNNPEMTEINSMIMEKVLANIFLQEDISKNFMVMERPDQSFWDDSTADGDSSDGGASSGGSEDGWVDVTHEFMDVAPESDKRSKWNAMTFITKIVPKFKNVDVILVGFLIEESEASYELHLRMVETNQGQVVAVGSSRIKRETIDPDGGFGTFGTKW